jgi:hypothetical protein
MIRDKDAAASQTAPEAAQQQAPIQQPVQAAPQMTQQSQSRFNGGIGNVNSFFERSGKTQGGDARSSEALQILTRLKDQAVAQQDLANDFQILRFDRDQNQVGWSSLVIVKAITLNSKPVIAIRPLIMPNAGIELPATKHTIQNGMHQEVIETEVDVATVFSKKYFARLVAFVQASLGKPTAEVVLAGAYPIPAEFDLKTGELQLRDLLIKSVNACDDFIARKSGETPFTVGILKGQDETLAAKIDTRDQPVHDVLGNPIRSDVVVSMQRVKRSGQAQENEFYEADVKLNQVSMFTNLEYLQTQQVAPVFGQQAQAPQAPCVAAVVVTDVRQADWIKANTPEMYWLAMTNAYRSTHGHAWARPFVPQTGKIKDLRDIGALGWLSQLQNKIDTKAASFDDAQFGQLMVQMVQQKPVFQIDLNRMGENGAVDGMLLDAAGGENQVKAVQAIARQIGNLINGDFKQFFDYTTQPILIKTGQIIDLGYYTDEDGEKRDRRELDNLGALNAAEGNVQEWWGYYGSQQNPHLHPAIRTKQSRNYDRQYLGATVTYTGKAERCTFNPKFIEALDAAICAAGLQVTMDNTSVLNSGQRFMGNSAIQQFMVGGQANVASFATGQQSYGAQNTAGVGSFY